MQYAQLQASSLSSMLYALCCSPPYSRQVGAEDDATPLSRTPMGEPDNLR